MQHWAKNNKLIILQESVSLIYFQSNIDLAFEVFTGTIANTFSWLNNGGIEVSIKWSMVLAKKK